MFVPFGGAQTWWPQCAVPENIHTPPTEGIGISQGEGGSLRLNNLKKCMELNWNFQRGGEVLGKIPSVGEVWIFSGTTQCNRNICRRVLLLR